MRIIDILKKAVAIDASDVFIVAGMPPGLRVNGEIVKTEGEKLMPDDTAQLITEIYQLAGGREMAAYQASGDDDFSFSISGLSRFRVSAYKQRGSLAAVIRVINLGLPDPKAIGIPDEIVALADARDGALRRKGRAFLH